MENDLQRLADQSLESTKRTFATVDWTSPLESIFRTTMISFAQAAMRQQRLEIAELLAGCDSPAEAVIKILNEDF